jgi:hypothetical protein
MLAEQSRGVTIALIRNQPQGEACGRDFARQTVSNTSGDALWIRGHQ